MVAWRLSKTRAVDPKASTAVLFSNSICLEKKMAADCASQVKSPRSASRPIIAPFMRARREEAGMRMSWG